MNIFTLIVRFLFGLMFVVFGSNAFLKFMPMPPMSGPAGDFIGAMYGSGYLQAVAALQVIGGILMFIPRLAPIGLLILGPIVVNIAFFHLFLERQGLLMAAIVGLAALFLLWRYRAAFPGFAAPNESL